MEGSAPVVLTHVLVLCAVGVMMEVVFTALADLPASGDLRLRGYTYLWMLPIYALVYPACVFLVPRLAGFHLLIRGLTYMLLIYAVEYASGRLLRRVIGECPWERGYRKARWNYDGLIRFDFAPAWVAAALIFEWTYRVLRGLA
jgi:hypothetical protein